jgi:hypothetical protein
MKKFEFKHQQKRWDYYNCFHASEGPFVEFETGEVILTRKPEPDQRKHYDRYGLQLVSTSDTRWCPQLYLDTKCTEEVKTAWITQGGQQVLAVDHEQRVAIKVNGRWGIKTDKLQYLGKHLQNAAAVWMGPERLPIPMAKITVSRPDRNMVKELTPKLEQVRTAVRAAARIQGIERPYWDDGRLGIKREWMGMTVEDICAYVCADKIWMRIVAFNGFTHPRAETQHDFLYIK